MKRALLRRWRLGACLLIAVGLAVSNAGAVPPCPVDFNRDGSVEVADIFAFLNAWFAGSPDANFDQLNGLQVQDIFASLNAWFAGC